VQLLLVQPPLSLLLAEGEEDGEDEALTGGGEKAAYSFGERTANTGEKVVRGARFCR
jgi:hypothetical protein